MTRAGSILLTFCAVFGVVYPAWGQSALDPSNYGLKLGNPRATSSGDRDDFDRFSTPNNFFESYLRNSAERTYSGPDLVAYSHRFYGIERYEVTRLNMVLEGAGAGATLGLFMGAVGTTTGLFDEQTGFYLMGAAAALGALLNGTVGADDPAKRVRYRWSIDAGASADRR